MADTFQWTTPVSGTFDVAGNWTDETNPDTIAAPGSLDTANLIGPASGPAQVIAGPGDVATLDVAGSSVLTGDITTGLTRIDSLTTPTTLDVLAAFSASVGLVVGDAGSGTLDIGTGGTLTASSGDGTDQVVIGEAADSSGAVTVAAGGTLLLTGPTTTADYGLTVGDDGAGTLVVSGAGATVDDVNQDGVAVGYGTGGSGALVVSNGATASFATSNSDDLSAVSVARSGDGSVIVDGQGSRLSANGIVYIGRAGAGTLIVADSGLLTQTNASEAIEIGQGSSLSNSRVGGTGTGTVTSDGTLSSAGAIHVGGYGVNGWLTISDGGVVSAVSNVNLGAAGSIDGTFEAGSGSIEIDGGGTMLVTGAANPAVAGVLLGGAQGSSGTLTMSGAGALLDSDNNLINVGSSGTGLLSVSDGASVLASSPGGGDAAIVLGTNATGVGTLDVSGAGSSVTATGALTAGYIGNGTIIVSSGGVVTAEAVFIGGSGGGTGAATISAGGTLTSTGTLAIGGATWSGALSMAGGLATAVNIGIGTDGTISGNGTIGGTLTNDGVIAASGGTLALAQAVEGSGVLTIGAGSDLVFGSSVASTATVTFTGAGERFDLLAPSGFAATVGNFASGDAIFAAGAASVTTSGGPAIDLLNASNQLMGTIELAQNIAPGALVDVDGLISYACFAAGTRIATGDGDVGVEALRAGDIVLTANGARAAVVWLGFREVACHRHPRPSDVWPVRIAAGAFGQARPARDLWLSPDHAVFVAGTLIPVRYLVNGRTIAQQPRATVAYFHVELARHDILLAEGLPCESYLDTGNRAAFANGGAAVQMQPDFARRVWQAQGCAPLVIDGPALAAVKQDLLLRAAALGATTTSEPALRVLADGRDLPAIVVGQCWRVRLPNAARTVRLRSRAFVPAQTRAAADDTRTLGVAVARLTLDGREVSLDSPGLSGGWHQAEAGWRWTDGDGELAVAGARELTFELAMTGTYWQEVAEVVGGAFTPALSRSAGEGAELGGLLPSPAPRERVARSAG